jgi:putative peptidoglycan lipid II flippase
MPANIKWRNDTNRSVDPTESHSMEGSTRSTILVMVCTLLSRLLGFIRNALLANIFGAGAVADVLLLTFAIPNNLRKLLAEGALSSAFIPVLSEQTVDDTSGRSAGRIVNNILAFQVLIILPLSLLVVLFSKEIVFLLSQFRDPVQIDLSARLFKGFIFYLLLVSVSAVMMGVLNTHGRFSIPALTPILFSVSVILVLLLLSERLGPYAMVLGVLMGGCVQILFQFPLFRRLGYSLRLNFRFDNPVFKKVIRQWLPVVATSSIFTINQYVATFFASGLEEGSVSAFQYGILFWQLPYGIFSASITTVLFPRMSKQAAMRDDTGLRETVQYGLRYIFSLLIPSSVILILLGKGMIAVAYQHGSFNAHDTMVTADVLSALSVGLFFAGVYAFLQRLFYSLGDYRFPFIVASVVCITDIVLSLWLKSTHLRVTGLAAANSISYVIGVILMSLGACRRIGSPISEFLFRTVWKVLTATAISGGFLYGYIRLFSERWADGSDPTAFLVVAAGGVLSILILVVVFLLLRVEILNILVRRRTGK